MTDGLGYQWNGDYQPDQLSWPQVCGSPSPSHGTIQNRAILQAQENWTIYINGGYVWNVSLPENETTRKECWRMVDGILDVTRRYAYRSTWSLSHMTSPYLLFSLNVHFHILHTLVSLEQTWHYRDWDINPIIMVGKKRSQRALHFQGGACTEYIIPNTKPEWVLVNTLSAPRCSAQYIEMYCYWLCWCR